MARLSWTIQVLFIALVASMFIIGGTYAANTTLQCHVTSPSNNFVPTLVDCISLYNYSADSFNCDGTFACATVFAKCTDGDNVSFGADALKNCPVADGPTIFGDNSAETGVKICQNKCNSQNTPRWGCSTQSATGGLILTDDCCAKKKCNVVTNSDDYKCWTFDTTSNTWVVANDPAVCSRTSPQPQGGQTCTQDCQTSSAEYTWGCFKLTENKMIVYVEDCCSVKGCGSTSLDDYKCWTRASSSSTPNTNPWTVSPTGGCVDQPTFEKCKECSTPQYQWSCFTTSTDASGSQVTIMSEDCCAHKQNQCGKTVVDKTDYICWTRLDDNSNWVPSPNGGCPDQPNLPHLGDKCSCKGHWSCYTTSDNGQISPVDDCCAAYPCREFITANLYACFDSNGNQDLTGASCGPRPDPIKCAPTDSDSCNRQYSLVCVNEFNSIVPCDCKSDPSSYKCGFGKRTVKCAYQSISTSVVFTLDSNCANQTVLINGQNVSSGGSYTCPERCENTGSWICQYTDAQQHAYFGPCNCDKFQGNQWTWHTSTSTDAPPGNSSVGNFTFWSSTAVVDLCDGIDSWGPLTPVCYDQINSTLYIAGINGTCDPQTKPLDDLDSCDCSEPAKTEWICQLDTPNGPLVLPCDTPCEKLFAYADRFGKQTCEVQLVPRCVIAGTTTPTAESNCSASKPTPPPCQDPKRCKYFWQCEYQGVSVPCSSIPRDLCRKYRSAYPCGVPDITSVCVNAFSLASVEPTFCKPVPQPSDADFLTQCPEIGDCGGDNKYQWGCGQKYENGTVIFNAASSSLSTASTATATNVADIDPFDRIKPRVCTCGPTCTGYWLFSHCMEVGTNTQVLDVNCDPALRPIVAEQFCKPNLPQDKCGSKCSLMCSIETNGQQVYFPCAEYQQYCKRFEWLSCNSVDIKVECGVVDSDGIFRPNEDTECCNKLDLPWGGNFSLPSSTFDCAKTVASFAVTDQSDDEIFESLMVATPDRGCFYGWFCEFNGQLVDCNCDLLRKLSYTEVFQEDGTISYQSDWCEVDLPTPTCYKWSSTNPTHISTAEVDCTSRGIVEPVLDETKCQEGCETEHKWDCYDSNGNHVPCSSPTLCQDLAVSGQHCDRFPVTAQCYENVSSAPGWSVAANSDCISSIGYPFPSVAGAINTLTSVWCAGEPRFCDNEPQGKYYWQCLVNGNPTLVLDAKLCDCSDLAQKLAGGCPYYVQSQCVFTNGYTTYPVSPSDCASANIGQAPSAKKCACKDETRYELVCYRNGDVNTPVPCNYECKYANSCDEHFVQAVCYNAVNHATVPLSNCANVPASFDASGYLKCQPSLYNKHCKVEWQCRAYHPDGTSFIYPCSQKDFCPRGDRCTQYKVQAVCVSHQSSGTFPVDSQICLSHGLVSPLGHPHTITRACPEVIPADCFTQVSYGWMCNEGSDLTAPFSLAAPPFACQRRTTCEDRLLADPRRCGSWWLSAQCYQTTYNVITQTTSYTIAPYSNCDWTQWPITDSSGFNISAVCHNKPCITGPVVVKRCKNGAINYPACNIFRIDDVIATQPASPAGNIDVSWGNNGNPDCVNGTALVLLQDATSPYAQIAGVAFASNGSARVNHTFSDLAVSAQIIDACGNVSVPGDDVVVPKWCAVVKCAAPRVCDEVQHACVCPKGKYGDDCALSFADYYGPICSKLNMVPDEANPPCRCESGIIDPRTGMCVDKCTQVDCANKGVFDQDRCACKCAGGFWGNSCECFERYFNLTFVRQPADWATNEDAWKALVAKYLAFDYGFPFDAVEVTTVSQGEKDFICTFRLRICDPKLLEAWLKFYEQFKLGYNAFFDPTSTTPAPFQLLADVAAGDEVGVETAFAQSDVSAAAGGAVSYSDVFIIDPTTTTDGENNAMIASFAFAVVIAAIAVVM